MKDFMWFIAILSLNANASVPDKVVAGSLANNCFTQGEIEKSIGQLDVAIAGEGWIPLRLPNGTLLYTRYGAFGMDRQGFLVHTPSNFPVVTHDKNGSFAKVSLASFVTKPFRGGRGRVAKLNAMTFSDEGELKGFYNDGDTAILTKLTLVAFENPKRLLVADRRMRLFVAPASVGELGYGQPLSHPFGKLFARSLEAEPEDRYIPGCRH